MKRTFALAALGLALAGLPACGLTGDLKRPGPLIGSPEGTVDPADLPGADGGELPPLPDRKGDTDPAADDELLGGPGS